MNPINRVGQKVVCLFDIDVISATGKMYRGARPEKDEVYTVTGFGSTGISEEGGRPDEPGIFLREVPPVQGRRPGGPIEQMPWPIIIFRPAFEGETDISELLALGNPAKVKERA